MHEAEALELPLGLPVQTKREESRFTKLWKYFQEVRDVVKEKGALLPPVYAADLLGISRQRVHQLVNDGRLESVELRGVRYVTEASLLAWAKSEHSSGDRLTVPGVRDFVKITLDNARRPASKNTSK
jgi:hypothetical protein